MSYTTWESISNKYSGGAAKIANTAELSAVIIPGAEAEINGRLASRYTVPFDPVPAIISDLCTDLAYCKLVIRDKKLYQQVKSYYDERMKMIEDGTMTVVLSTGAVLSNESNFTGIDCEDHSVFGVDDPVNWQPDTDALDRAEGSRDDD
jgi:phage gp36-like protein